MRIAYIVPSLANAGPVNVVRDLCEVFSRNGHQCTVFCFDDKVEQAFPCPVQRLAKGEVPNFTDFDVVHSHCLRPDLFVARHREHGGKVKYISTMHNYLFQDLSSNYNRIVGVAAGSWWLWNLRKHDTVVALSKHAVTYYRQWLPARKITWAYNTRNIDSSMKLSPEELAELIAFKGDSFLIGINASLNRRKRVDRMLKALVELPECRLFVAGSGPLRSKLEALSVQLGVADRCMFAGQRALASRYLPHYDAMALVSDSEGFPLALLEAAAFGCASVSSDLPVIKECFNENEVAQFSPNEKGALAAAVRRVMSDKEGFGERLKSRYDRDYAPEHFYQRHLDIYRGETR